MQGTTKEGNPKGVGVQHGKQALRGLRATGAACVCRVDCVIVCGLCGCGCVL